MNRKSLTALIAILSAILVACIVVGFILLREDTGSDKKTDGTGSTLVVDGTGEGQADPTGDSAGVVNTDNKKPGTSNTDPNGATRPEQEGDPDNVDPDDPNGSDPDAGGNNGGSNNGGNNGGSDQDEESTEPTVGVEEGTEATTNNDLVIDFDDLINAGKH